MSTPAPPAAARRPARAWLAAALVVLLTGTYLVAWLTYARLHLPPQRYTQLPPGASATFEGAEFTLLRLRQTTRFGTGTDGPQRADPDAVWLVADLTVTRHEVQRYFSCTLYAVSADRHAWPTSDAFVTHDGESCAPDDAVLGRPYPVVVYFSVPAAEVGSVVGLSLPSYGWRPEQVLTPAR